MIVTATGAVDESDGIVVADAIHVAVGPNFDSNRILSALEMRVNLIRRTVDDIDVSTIGLPAGRTGRSAKTLVGESDAAVVFLLELVIRCAGRGIAARPELLDELVAFLVAGELLEGGALGVVNNVDHVLVESLGVSRFVDYGKKQRAALD